MRTASTRLTSTNHPANAKGEPSGAVGAGAHPGTPGTAGRRRPDSKQTPHPKSGTGTISDHARRTLND